MELTLNEFRHKFLVKLRVVAILHRSELEKCERLRVTAHTGLTKQHRTARCGFHSQCDSQQQRKSKNNQAQTAGNIDSSFDIPATIRQILAGEQFSNRGLSVFSGTRLGGVHMK